MNECWDIIWVENELNYYYEIMNIMNDSRYWNEIMNNSKCYSEILNEFIKFMMIISDYINCYYDLDISLLFLFNSFSMISMIIYQQDFSLLNIYSHQFLISDKS